MPTSANKFYIGSVEPSKIYSGSTEVYTKTASEPGLTAHFDFNDPGDTETFDKVSSVRMALTDISKVPAYNGLGASMNSTTSQGISADGFLNRSAFSVAVRQLGSGGGGVEFPSATGTAIRVLSRDTGTVKSFLCQAWQGGTVFSAGVNSSSSTYDIPAGIYYWTFLTYDGSLLTAYYNNMKLKAGVPLTGLVDQPTSMKLYRNASSLVDDVRVFDYAISEAKIAEMVAE